MGVPQNCRDPDPNLYKQCAAPIDELDRRREMRDQIKEYEGWETERVESEIENSSELRIVPELRAKSRLIQNVEFKAKVWWDRMTLWIVPSLIITDN